MPNPIDPPTRPPLHQHPRLVSVPEEARSRPEVSRALNEASAQAQAQPKKRRGATKRAGPRYGQAKHEPGDAQGALLRVMEGEIIPRLLLAHHAYPGRVEQPAQALAGCFSSRAVDEFSQLVLTQDIPVIQDHVETLLDRGHSVEDVFLGLLAPAARRLGEYWASDYCSFVDVTIGLGRLQQVLLAMRLDSSVHETQSTGPGTALFATVEVETHSFGLLMVDEIFRRAGWRTVTRIGASPSEVAALVRASGFDLVGFGVSCQAGLAQAGVAIKKVRQASLNRSVRVMLGGAIFLEQPDLGADLGADMVALSAQDAIAKAERALGIWEGRV